MISEKKSSQVKLDGVTQQIGLILNSVHSLFDACVSGDKLNAIDARNDAIGAINGLSEMVEEEERKDG